MATDSEIRRGGNGHTEQLAAAPAEAWTGRVLPLEKGAAVATSERRAATPVEKGDGAVLRIPLRDIIQIITALLAIAAIVWTLRSDIRDLKTSMEANNRLQDERWGRQVEDMKEFKGTQKLQGMDINDLKLALAAAGMYQPQKPVTITAIPKERAP